MKNLKSLQVVALAGLAIAFTAGCSSTSSGRMSENSSSNSDAAYRWVSSGGWAPITDTRKTIIFPVGWTPDPFGPVSYETYIMTPPAVGETATGAAAMTTTSTGSSTTVATDGTTTTVTAAPGTTVASNGTTTTVTTQPAAEFSESLRPGDTFVEAAGANSDEATVRRVILYSPFNTPGVGH